MSLAHISLTTFVAIFARSFGAVLSVPWGDTLGIPSKALLALGSSLMVVPTISTEPSVSLWFVGIEFAIGFALASPLRLLLDLCEALGEMIDVARGQMIAAAVDPLNGHGISDLSALFRLAALVVAIHYGALDLLLLGLAHSYTALHIGALHDPGAFVADFLRGAACLCEELLGIAVVWFGVFVLVECICVLCARAYRGLPWSALSSILKAVVTFALLGGLVVAHGPGGAGRSAGVVSVTLQWLGSISNQSDRLIPQASQKR